MTKIIFSLLNNLLKKVCLSYYSWLHQPYQRDNMPLEKHRAMGPLLTIILQQVFKRFSNRINMQLLLKIMLMK